MALSVARALDHIDAEGGGWRRVCGIATEVEAVHAARLNSERTGGGGPSLL